jgi:cytoskeletal protein CcmA (bactofilin family)
MAPEGFGGAREGRMMFAKTRDQEPVETPQRRLEDEASVRETVIAKGSTVQGKLLGPVGVHVVGRFEGDIKIEGLLWIEPQGEVQGTVSARGVIVEGELRGNIESADKVELRTSGRVLGDIRCRKLAMAEGCFFQGGITMPEETGQPLPFVEKRQSSTEGGGQEPSG